MADLEGSSRTEGPSDTRDDAGNCQIFNYFEFISLSVIKCKFSVHFNFFLSF